MITRRNFVSYSALALASQTRGTAAPGSLLQQVRSGQKIEGVDIVDAHTHFMKRPADLFWPRNVEALMADAERCGVGQIIASHPDAYMATSGDQIKAAHDEAVESAAKYPKRLRLYLVFHPRQVQTSV